jgi:hypothetical protein
MNKIQILEKKISQHLKNSIFRRKRLKTNNSKNPNIMLFGLAIILLYNGIIGLKHWWKENDFNNIANYSVGDILFEVIFAVRNTHIFIF